MPRTKPIKRRGSRSASSASAMPTPLYASPTSLRGAISAERSPLPRLLTIDEVAELLRTSRKAIYTQISRGALPGVIRLPRRLLVDRAQLLEWLDHKRAVSLTTQGEQR